jgi:signal transduction histidine kinase/CheY-like chemotaxis protein
VNKWFIYTICLSLIFSQKLFGGDRNITFNTEIAELYDDFYRIQYTFDIADYLDNSITNDQINSLFQKKQSNHTIYDSIELTRLYFALNDFKTAYNFAENVYNSSNYSFVDAQERFKLNLLWAETMQRQGKKDEAIQFYKTIANGKDALITPSFANLAIIRVINLYLNAGQTDEAALFLDALDANYLNQNLNDSTVGFYLEKIRFYAITEPEKTSDLFDKLWSSHENLSYLTKARLLAVAILTQQPNHIIADVVDVLLACLPMMQPESAAATYRLIALVHQKLATENPEYYKTATISETNKILNLKYQLLSSLSVNDNAIQAAEEKASAKKLQSQVIMWVLTLVVIFLIGWLTSRIIKNAKQKNNSLSHQKMKLHEDINDLHQNIQLGEDELYERINDRIETIKNELHERERIDQELKDALDNAEKANYLKNAFLANMSHEIRTPLNGILGFANLLETELALMDNPELYEYANSIEKSGERLLHLLNNIIDISRLEANDIPLKSELIEIKNTVHHVIENFHFKANEKGIKIVSQLSDANVVADKQTFARIMSEVIDNAIKYTEKGFVKITLDCNNSKQRCFIKIQDTGIGIDQDYLPHIFEAFRQESLGYTRQYQGAGLGLPLAKRLCQKMGGTLDINSEKAIGTTVVLSFPLHEERNVQVTSSNNVLPIKIPNRALNIFLVEDDAASRVILSKMLLKHATIYTACDGDEAISLAEKLLAEKTKIDVFLFDINLPAPWDGIKLLKHFKKMSDVFAETPFIAQTAYAMVGDEEKILAEGFNAYLSKPVQKESLFHAIFQWSNKLTQ